MKQFWKRFICHLTLHHRWNFQTWAQAVKNKQNRQCQRCGVIG